MRKRILPIPLILLIPILLLIAVVVAGTYRLNTSHEEIAAKQGRYVKSDQEGKAVMLHLFSLKDAQPWRVAIPDTMASAMLTDIPDMATNTVAQGNYRNGPEVGTVSLDYSQLLVLYFKDQPSSQMTFVAPYSVSNQGSGVFYYLGLFRLDHQHKKVDQLDYQLLGDRIQNLALSLDHPFDVTQSIIASFKKHSDKQAMAESPSEQTSLTIHSSPTTLE
ncbi:hypothetical protein [Vibrio sp. SCSIO 43136]|uniref:hypothetical protein n=1 Tax=Vibrio sp. SCSIO 43136 TaxID=2819101 RepID=UPI0020751C26|nr:hypothetical protein [Vibrio sp. SCSIO 43136]USD66868.1 hypothetical protein J4N39_19650 [Vibrio sp. SCSIO 43136]